MSGCSHCKHNDIKSFLWRHVYVVKTSRVLRWNKYVMWHELYIHDLITNSRHLGLIIFWTSWHFFMTWKIIKTKSEDSKFIQKSLQSEVDIFHQKCRNYGNNDNKDDDDDDDDDDDITGSSLTYLWYTERSCSNYIISHKIIRINYVPKLK